MIMNESTFPNDRLHIQWTLQLCANKAATWKHIQLDLLESSTDVPDYLLDWDVFQEEFLLKWADFIRKTFVFYVVIYSTTYAHSTHSYSPLLSSPM